MEIPKVIVTSVDNEVVHEDLHEEEPAGAVSPVSPTNSPKRFKFSFVSISDKDPKENCANESSQPEHQFKKFGPSIHEQKKKKLSEGDESDNSFVGGLWFKGHTPLPSEDEEEEEDTRFQMNKILNYEHEFALPRQCEPVVLNNKTDKLVHNEYSFNEKDFIRHRAGSQALQSVTKHLIESKPHHRRRKHHSSKHSHKFKSVDNEIDGKENVDALPGQQNDSMEKELENKIFDKPEHSPRVEKDFARRPKSFTVTGYMSPILPPVNENVEVSAKDDGVKFDPNRRLSLQESLGIPTETRQRHKHKHKNLQNRNHHHRHHHHARHLQHKQVLLSDTLELRIKSGMQTLEEERKAIREIVTEIEQEFGQKDIDDMTSHRFGNFQSSVRHITQPKRHHRSGMITHLSDVESVCSVKPARPHMHIDMEIDVNNTLQNIPREQSHYGKNKSDEPESGFVELEELTTNENNELEWKERARWIKFEEDVEKNERWGKPHVASLSFQSLLELRRGIEKGSVLLNLDNFDMPTIFESVADNMIITDQIPSSMREKLIGILLSKHCHHHQSRTVGSVRQRKSSTTSLNSFPRTDSSVDVDSGIDSNHDIHGHLNGDVIEMEKLNLLQEHKTPTQENMITPQISFEQPTTTRLGRITSIDDYFDDSDIDKYRENIVKFAPVTEEPKGHDPKTESDVKDKVPEGAEATSVLVATLADLTRTAMAFVRLSKGCYLGNLTEVVIPIRFLFIILGPPSTSNDYYEIGRSIATLMSDKVFHDLAYSAKNRDDLLAAINSFLDDSIVLAPGDWDRHLLLPLLQAEISEKRRERIKLLKEKAHLDVPTDEQPFLRTGKPFGGLKRDIIRKKKHFLSDFKDGLNLRCFVTIIFVFFATLAPTITFGALLSKKTQNNLGAIETLLATSLCGIIFSLTAGQPLIIVGTTGPILVFEQAVFDLCDHFKIDFLVWRCWVGIMVMLILWTVVALEGCFLVEYFTRFIEEVFSVLISLLFIYECISFIGKTTKDFPLHQDCPIVGNYSNGTNPLLHSCGSANISLLSMLLVLGTFFIASYLRKLRFSHFLSSKSRRVLSDFGVPIAMVVMVSLNFVHDIKDIPKIEMPHSFRPTAANRTYFFINPTKNIEAHWVALGVLPAICVSILLFMETELTGVLLNKRKNKLKKGCGYNLDLFVMGSLTGLCSILGLPWMCAATVRSVQHQNALAIMSRSHAPGERPYLLHIKEQRLTNFCIHLLMGLCIVAVDVIESIPLAVCFGVFMYLGFSSLSGIQFIEQIKLIFIPAKYHPNRKYVRCVRFRSLVIYTLIQIVCLILLIVIKLTPAAPGFPFFIIGMVFLRRMIEYYFTEDELEDLDNEDDDDELDDFDEYGITLPM